MSGATGIDIGGTRCRAVRLDATGAVVAHAVRATPRASADELLAAVVGLAEEVGRSSMEHALRRGVGVGLPGIVDEAGVMRRAVNLECLEGVGVRPFFSAALGADVLIDTDVNAAAWAQWRRSPSPAERFAYLSVGTGVGAGVILRGELVRHTHNGPGHWGHVIVDGWPDAPRCRCGAKGCVEAVVAGAAWGDGSGIGDRASGMGDRMRYGGRARALAATCLQLASVYAVDVIALGGGVIDARPGLVDDVRRDMYAMRGSVTPDGLRIDTAPLPSDQAGAIGAALLAMGRRHAG